MPVQDIRADLVGRLRSSQVVNDPYLGQGSAAAFEAGSALWPGDRWSSVERVFVTEADGRRLEEFRYVPADGHRAVLPVAIMFDRAAGGGRRAIVYSDHHLVPDRGPIHRKVPGIHPWRSDTDICAPISPR